MAIVVLTLCALLLAVRLCVEEFLYNGCGCRYGYPEFGASELCPTHGGVASALDKANGS